MKITSIKMLRNLFIFGGALSLIFSISAFADSDKESRHEKHMEKMFSKMDTDGDGKISKQEAQAAATARFDKVDANKDGYVTKDEAAAAAKEMKKKHQHSDD
ncbi:EF-hand domain-containing protein [Candidatus Nitrosacidococcus tergens]|uniref:EF-hand domain-containing protein n=1 Tax=Candidatus Nitrosacidococcus tergens TaxID=553981 RepID=A0A7G1Q790_9GAMM|nr:EF-hand domain-containing protein [Candidatus Nitrosacidococcus tergens]CAB1274190.1 conserved exported protein of unknown function [Candidatus Nitrosacidococcus tergens]